MIGMAESDNEAFFRREGEVLVPAEVARGPWDPNSMHGRLLAGMLAHTVEQRFGQPDFHFARMTIDLFRLPPLAPYGIEVSLRREGNRIRVAEGSITSGGVEVARGSVVMLRRAEEPEGDVWSPPDWDVQGPEEVGRPDAWGGGAPRGMPMWETRPITDAAFPRPGGAERAVEQKRAWIRESRLLVTGEPLTPFVRAAVAADYTNPFANSGSRGLNFVNADITLYLHRLPMTAWIGFEVSSHQSADGICVGECTLYDERGAIGKSIVCGVANQRAPGAWGGPRRPARS
jgi:hypothetical protein